MYDSSYDSCIYARTILGNFQKQLLLLLTEAETARHDFYQEL